jgi:uncharacterized membrane protein
MKISKIIILVLCVLTVVISCDKKPFYKEAPFDGSNVVIDAKTMKEGAAEFYSLVLDGRRINFFLLMINGNIDSYFDACLECYPKKLGFRVDGRHIVCKACNVGYPVEELKKGIGSCYPIQIKGTVKDGKYIIKKDDIKAGKAYF